MVNFTLNTRNINEKNSEIRKSGLIPGIIYGGKENINVSANLSDFKKVLENAGRSNIVEVSIDGKKMLSLVKDFQLHPLTDEFIHFDLLEVSEAKEVRVQVPIEYTGTPKGVKEGGVLEILQDKIELACKVKDIPSNIVVDISHLESGFSIHLKDVAVPKNSRFTYEPGTVLAVVTGDVAGSSAEEDQEK